jgi:hypothetical protein
LAGQHEQLVADSVSQTVVDLFEAVQVDIQDSQTLSGAGARGQRKVECRISASRLGSPVSASCSARRLSTSCRPRISREDTSIERSRVYRSSSASVYVVLRMPRSSRQAAADGLSSGSSFSRLSCRTSVR